MEILPIIAAIILGYLMGSVPFGLLIAKASGQGDIRDIGSGSIGATNVLRTGRKDLAALTVVLDALKAGGAGWVIAHFFGQPFGYIAAAAALLGHCYPVWLGFKGGKGVATFFGALLVLVPTLGILAAGIWLLAAYFSRTSSLSALVTAALVPILPMVDGNIPVFAMTMFMAVVIFWRHKDNIDRLFKGEEPKLGQKSDKPPSA